jgi:F1F0 ATPase subunit 2
MNEVAQVVAVLGAGALLGTLYFGGLWWTVRHGLTAENPALWFGVSALTRMTALLAGLYYFIRGGWISLLACLVGVSIARVAIMRFARFARH